MDASSRKPADLPVALLIAALAIAGGLTLVLTRDMTFYQDTWAFLLGRREITTHTLFAPQNEHIVVFPMLIELALVRVFGMTSALPEYVLMAIGLVGSASLLFVYLKRRVGQWFALFGAVLVLFLGPAWEVLLWPFEIGFVGSVFFGLAAVLSMERGDRRGDMAACLFLTLSAGFSSLGIPFLVGAAVAILTGPSERRLKRAFVVAVPALLFVAWYLGWGHVAESHFSFKNVLASPRYVVEMGAANIGSVFGLGPDPATGALGRGPNPEVGLDPVWGRLIVLLLVVGFAVRQWRGARLSPRFWPIAAIALTNWFLTAFNQFPGREPTNSRYQYAGAIFALMLIASVFDGARPQRRAVVVAAIASVFAIAPNLVVLGNGADFLNEQSVLTRSDTAALEIARETVDPSFQLSAAVAGTPTLPNVFAGEYFAATAEHGSPAYTPAELEAAPEAGRFQADVVLANALPMSNSTEIGGFGAGASNCLSQPAGAKTEIALKPGGTTRIEVAPGPDASFNLRRYASGEYPIHTEGVLGGSASVLTIPADTVSLPWYLLVEAEQLVRICR